MNHSDPKKLFIQMKNKDDMKNIYNQLEENDIYDEIHFFRHPKSCRRQDLGLKKCKSKNETPADGWRFYLYFQRDVAV